MRYKLFGKSGLRVSEICLGTMTFGEDWGWGSSNEESRKVFDLFVNQGGNFLDTACNYTNGSSEKIVGELIASERARYVLATKYSLSMNPKDPNAGGNHRKNLVQSVHQSLKRLKTDYIDLLWLHAWDYMTPVEEVMRAFDDLVRAGTVLYVGASDTPAWVVSQANALAAQHGWTPITGLQLEYSLLERNIEREHIPMAETLDLAITPWSPLAGGYLTGKYLSKTPKEARFSIAPGFGEGYHTPFNQRIVETVVAIAKQVARSPAQVALNWLRQRPGVIIPIVGAKNAHQLKDSLDCLTFELSPDQMQKLNEVSRIPMGFPYDFLASKLVRPFLYGETFDVTDNHRSLQSLVWEK